MDNKSLDKKFVTSKLLTKLGNKITHRFFSKNINLEDINYYFPTSQFISLTKQVHGDHIKIVTPYDNNPVLTEADAQITNNSNIALAVKTADCGCILLSDVENNVIATIHSGWRSTAQAIIPKTIEKMVELGANKNKIFAALGPTIQQSSYEVGSEVKDVISNLGSNYNKHFISKPNSKYLFNLPGCIINQLEDSGVHHLDNLGIDTYTNEKMFNSYRRSCHKNIAFNNNIQYSVIMLNKNNIK